MRLPGTVLFSALLLLSTGALTGCAGGTPGTTDPSTTALSTTVPSTASAMPGPNDAAVNDPGTESEALGLINLWRVTGASGETADTWLRIDVDEMLLWRPCGAINYSWAAADTRIITEPTGYSMDCGTGASQPPAASWLDEAIEFRAHSDGWQLLDDSGHVVATLGVDGAPQPIPTLAGEYAKPPVVTEQTRKAFAQPEPLRNGFAPATSDTLVGTWKPVGEFSTDPHVTFAADRSAKSSDGCNGMHSRWVILDHGRFMATVGGITEIGCDGAPVPEWVSTAVHAGFTEDQLVLFDVRGSELGRFDRA